MFKWKKCYHHHASTNESHSRLQFDNTSAAITTADTFSSLAICCPQQYASTSVFATTQRTRSRHFYSWIKTKHFLLFLGKVVFQLDQFPSLVCHELDTNACVGTLWDADAAY